MQTHHLHDNPYVERRDHLTWTIAGDESLTDQLSKELLWYGSFDAAASRERLRELLQANSVGRSRLEYMETELKNLCASIEAHRPRARLGWNPLHWWSVERRRHAAQLKALQRSRRALTADICAAVGSLDSDRLHASGLQDDLMRHAQFDAGAASDRLHYLKTRLAAQQEELVRVVRQCQAIAQQLGEPLSAIEDVRARLGMLHRELSAAERVAADLERARTPKGRWRAHQRCTEQFGRASPAWVIRDKRSEINAAKRTLAKLEERLATVRKRVCRRILGLVIDGNNLCFQNKTFIGLDALHKVVAALAPLYPVTVVFDASIRKLARISDAAINAQFPAGVAVHIVGVQTQADETILEAASRDGMYVISNDRFGDYPAKAVVAHKRIIGHEIVNNRVMIHELNVVEDFGSIHEAPNRAPTGPAGQRTAG